MVDVVVVTVPTAVFSCRDKARVEVDFSDLDRRNFAQILRKKIL